MKKIAAILVAFLVAAGLAAASSPAEAKAAYPGTVATYCHVTWKHNPVKYGHANPVRYWVATNGTGRPHGRVTIKATSKHHQYVRTYSYYGGKTYHRFRKMQRGHYAVQMTFRAPSGSVYKACGRTGHRLVVR